MTHAESSYEGAVRRMRLIESQRLPPPAFDLAGARQRALKSEPELTQLSRVRDLEELASLSCEENERLEAELAKLRDENASLHRRITMLEAAIADPRTALGLTALPSSGADELEPDELPMRGAWLRAAVATVAIGLCGAVTLTIAAGLLASDAGVLGVSRLRSPFLGAADGAATMLDDVIAHGGEPHPRYGRDLVPAGWAPTLPAPAPEPAVVTPKVTAPVAPLAATEPVVAAPAKAHKAKAARSNKAAARAKAPKKKPASLSHKAKKANDPLAGLDL